MTRRYALDLTMAANGTNWDGRMAEKWIVQAEKRKDASPKYDKAVKNEGNEESARTNEPRWRERTCLDMSSRAKQLFVLVGAGNQRRFIR
jgi:hypothetical protein